jgi:hypothetical protein
VASNGWSIVPFGDPVEGWEIRDELTNTVYDAIGGTPFGLTWVDAGDNPPPPTTRQATVADLCPCPPTEVDVTVNDTAFGTATGSTFNVPVVNEADTATGSLVDGKWVVPTAKSLCTLITEEDVSSGADCIRSSGKQAGYLANLIPAVDEAQVVPQVYGPLTTEQRDTLKVTVQLVDSANTPIGTADEYLPTTSTAKTAPDSTITLPDGSTVGLPATAPFDVRDLRSGIAYPSARMLHSGQTTAFQTNDEGTMLADGFFDDIQPLYPAHYAQLANFTTLVNNNMYGNTLRFTARDSGAAAATSGNRWIRDHFLRNDYYVLGSLPSGNWSTMINSIATLRTTLGEGDIYHVNDRILDQITDGALAVPLNYAPFNITLGGNFWTATTNAAATGNAFFLTPTGAFGNGTSKATSQLYGIYVKRFA